MHNAKAHIGQGGRQGRYCCRTAALSSSSRGAELFNQLTVILCDQGLSFSLIVLRG